MSEEAFDLEKTLSLINENSTSIETLSLRYKSLSSSQLEQIIKALYTNTSVTSLHLSGNEINLSLLEQLAEYAFRDLNLKPLLFSTITDLQLHLRRSPYALLVLPRLLFDNLCSMLKKNARITRVDLRFCELKDDAVPALLDAITGREVPLVQLQLMGNGFSPDNESQLNAVVKQHLKRSDIVLSRNVTLGALPSQSGEPRTPRSTVSMSGDGLSLRAAQSFSMASSSTPSRDPATQAYIANLTARVEELMKLTQAQEAQLKKLEKKKEKVAEEEKKKMKGQIGKRKVAINLNHVQINEQIAETGGSGASVFSCLVDGWQCAMKEMDLSGVHELAVHAFEAEIELLERLPYHPNIVRYLFHEKKGSKLRFFMTKYSSSLRRIISKRKLDLKKTPDVGYFKMSDIARWCVAVANGLEFLHKNNVIHRDMKPDNVLCTLDVHGEVQSLAITDFDTAKTISKTSQAKTTIGTPSYMCPEVICSGNSLIYTSKADVWGMGMVIYELVTLKEPYEDEDVFEVPSIIQKGQRPVILESFATEYKPLLDIFKACTVKAPESRPDIKEVREQLQLLSWA